MGISREILKELSGVTTEHALSEMVAIFNLPAGLSLKLVQAVVKSGAQHIMGNCYDDIASRSLSVKEEDKHDRVFKIAENIFTKQRMEGFFNEQNSFRHNGRSSGCCSGRNSGLYDEQPPGKQCTQNA